MGVWVDREELMDTPALIICPFFPISPFTHLLFKINQQPDPMRVPQFLVVIGECIIDPDMGDPDADAEIEPLEFIVTSTQEKPLLDGEFAADGPAKDPAVKAVFA